MRILMLGRGVTATIYGWALEQAGHEVEYYVRPGRATTYGPTVHLDLVDTRHGPRGRPIIAAWPVRYREELEPEHDFDLIVLSVAHNRLTDAAQFLAPRLGHATVLVFGNIWSDPLDARSLRCPPRGSPGASRRPAEASPTTGRSRECCCPR